MDKLRGRIGTGERWSGRYHYTETNTQTKTDDWCGTESGSRNIADKP